MKKLLPLLAILFTISSCDKTNTDAEPAGTTVQPSDKKRLVYKLQNTGNDAVVYNYYKRDDFLENADASPVLSGTLAADEVRYFSINEFSS